MSGGSSRRAPGHRLYYYTCIDNYDWGCYMPVFGTLFSRVAYILWKRVFIISAGSLYPAAEPLLRRIHTQTHWTASYNVNIYSTRNKVTLAVYTCIIYIEIGRTIVIRAYPSFFFIFFFFFCISEPLTHNRRRRAVSPSSNINATHTYTYNMHVYYYIIFANGATAACVQ